MFTKKSLGAVVATALLIVVSVLAVIGFNFNSALNKISFDGCELVEMNIIYF